MDGESCLGESCAPSALSFRALSADGDFSALGSENLGLSTSANFGRSWCLSPFSSENFGFSPEIDERCFDVLPGDSTVAAAGFSAMPRFERQQRSWAAFGGILGSEPCCSPTNENSFRAILYDISHEGSEC